MNTNPPTRKPMDDGPEWWRLKAWLDERIAESLNRLETPGFPTESYDVLRGHLAAYRALVAAVEEKPIPIPASPPNYHGHEKD